MAQQSVSFG